MKKYFAIVLAAVAAIACQKEINEPQVKGVFTASVESYDETKTFTDATLQVKWSKDDYLNIWEGSTVADKYTISETSVGKNTADLVLAQKRSSSFSGKLPTNIGYYPYNESIACVADGDGYKLTGINLPATQTYVENSFGNGALPMVAVTSGESDYALAFRNVCGVLRIVLKGDMLVKTISVMGNSNEVLCGAAEVSASNTAMPAITMNGDGKTVTLDCGEGIQVSSKTSFDIVLPPMTFEKGFSISVNGKPYFKTDKQQTIVRSRILCMGNRAVVSNNYLTFTSEGETSIALTKNGTPDDISIMYFKESEGEWKPYTIGDAISLTDGESLYFKAGEGGNATFSKEGNNFYIFRMNGDGKVKASGNIMSLLDASCESVTCPEYCFYELFNDCTALTTAPDLPATNLSGECYGLMFFGCTGLTTAPALPATTLAYSCYSGMFYGCASLETAPSLPAAELESGCYASMFVSCTALSKAPALPAMTLAGRCYRWMFSGCSGLSDAPELPATVLADLCYSGMFEHCTSLASAPALPVATLASYCYAYMFNGCTGLMSAPELPATTLAYACYEGMFCNCTNLSSAPELPATTLEKNCYHYMFNDCSSLNYIKMLATDISATKCLYEWTDGVSSTGTFVKNAAATWDVRGTSGIPDGWTVKTEGTAQATDLSEAGTANCYIVSSEGTYKFKTVQGNTDTSVGTVASASVLWESFGTDTAPTVADLVSDASYADGYITFKASDKKGNAVIAAKDANGTILWSWHIWMTDKPEDQEYNNNAGTMMDRNLGATSATKGDVGALGLLYQWGRKDPFLGGCSISYSSSSNQTKAASTITWPAPVESNATNGTIAYATANPTTFITRNTSNYDWYYTGSTSTDNTRWQTSDKDKGMYDPCPAGYRVPDGGSTGVWSKAFGTSSYWTTSSNWDSTNKGMDFGSTDKTLGSGTIWYPASGYLNSSNGSLGSVGNRGRYWSCTPSSYNAYYLYFYYDGYVYPSLNFNRANGRSVRCASE